MNTYKTTSGLSLEGENLEMAIKQNFNKIAQHLHIDNAAGYQLGKAYAEYDSEIRAVVLHITACRSNAKVNYDPAEDAPKTYKLIINATEDDCPVRIDYDIKESDKSSYDPFDDACLPNSNSLYGTALAIMNEVSLNHCQIPVTKGLIPTLIRCRPALDTAFPNEFMNYCLVTIMHFRPGTDHETIYLMGRACDLIARLWSANYKIDAGYWSYYYLTQKYFKTIGKITPFSL